MTKSLAGGAGLIVLGIGIAVSAVLGPLVLGVIKLRTSVSVEHQFLGSELVSLGVVAPVAIVTGILWIRGHPMAPAIALAPTLFSVYTYTTAILGQEYGRYDGNVEKAFPLYAVLVGGGSILAAVSWFQLSRTAVAIPPRRLRLTAAFVLIVAGALIALAWAAQIRLVITGRPPVEYLEGPTLFWVIKLLDFGFAIPAAIGVGIGLLQENHTAVRLACGLSGFFTCLAGAVAAMAVAMTIKSEPSSQPMMIPVLILLAGGLAILTVCLVRAVFNESDAPAMSVRPISRVIPLPHLV